MELEEFVRLNPSIIRRDKELMQLFVNFYEAAFSFKPKCAGCSFKGGFKKLKQYVNNSNSNLKINKMSAKTFQLKSKFRVKILSYKKDGITYRKYGHALTEEFAIELVKAGKGDLFIKTPDDSKKKTKDIEVNEPEIVVTYIENKTKNFVDMDYRTELVPFYKELSEKLDKKAKSFKR